MGLPNDASVAATRQVTDVLLLLEKRKLAWRDRFPTKNDDADFKSSVELSVPHYLKQKTND
jgi:hypothetical protein